MYCQALYEFHKRKEALLKTRQSFKMVEDFITREINSHNHDSQIEVNLANIRDLLVDLRETNSYSANEAIINVLVGCGAIKLEGDDSASE